MTTREHIVETLRQDHAAPADWEGFGGWTLAVGDRPARFVLPDQLAPGAPWFWRPEFFGAFAETDLALLRRGWTLGFLDLPDHYGCPAAVARFADLHDYAVGRLHLAPRVAIVALSRGGLSGYHFAAAHPGKTLAIYADNPVCDFRSWPGGLGAGPGSAGDWEKLLRVYGLSDAEARGYDKQPLGVLEPIVRAGIPAFHVCGTADETVPFAENTVLLAERFRALGGDYREVLKPGGLHHPHGLTDPTPVVTFFEEALAASRDRAAEASSGEDIVA